MSYGAALFGTAPFGATEPPSRDSSHEVSSLGYIVGFGTPFATADAAIASLGCVASFGGPLVGAGSVYRVKSLGVVARFGSVTTPGAANAAAASLGYVARFGGPIAAIKFKQRAAA